MIYIIKYIIKHYNSPNLDWVTDILSLKLKMLCYWKEEGIVNLKWVAVCNKIDVISHCLQMVISFP